MAIQQREHKQSFKPNHTILIYGKLPSLDPILRHGLLSDAVKEVESPLGIYFALDHDSPKWKKLQNLAFQLVRTLEMYKIVLRQDSFFIIFYYFLRRGSSPTLWDLRSKPLLRVEDKIAGGCLQRKSRIPGLDSKVNCVYKKALELPLGNHCRCL